MDKILIRASLSLSQACRIFVNSREANCIERCRQERMTVSVTFSYIRENLLPHLSVRPFVARFTWRLLSEGVWRSRLSERTKSLISELPGTGWKICFCRHARYVLRFYYIRRWRVSLTVKEITRSSYLHIIFWHKYHTISII